MRLSVIALDYDGTIARRDTLDPGVRQAMAEARAHRIAVVIVTGRRLDDLRRVVGELHFVDAVVAENGAVLHFPSSGYTATLGPSPSPLLLQALSTRGIAYAAGQCVVEADASDAPGILDAVRRQELPLSLAFNRQRVMVLPQSISKATGLKEVLTVLRLSPHSTVAIGGAENDHELLRACEAGVAVRWGSGDAKPTGRRARTLRELVTAMEEAPSRELELHVRRGDFSRWIGNVFGDYPLAAAIRQLEERCCHEHYPDAVAAIADTIRGRYDLADESLFSPKLVAAPM